MILETAQMLSFVSWKVSESYPSDRVRGMYKARGVSFAKHPCTRWAQHSEENFDWLIQHGLALCAIYTQVYGKRHKSQDVIEKSREFTHLLPQNVGLTPFVNCTEFKSILYTNRYSTTQLYKMFMGVKWLTRDKKPPTWQKRATPSWFNEELFVK